MELENLMLLFVIGLLAVLFAAVLVVQSHRQRKAIQRLQETDFLQQGQLQILQERIAQLESKQPAAVPALSQQSQPKVTENTIQLNRLPDPYDPTWLTPEEQDLTALDEPPPLPQPPSIQPQRQASRPVPVAQPEKAAGSPWLERIKNWFTTGNVPVKIGMVVLFAGVAALLKYASEQGWVQFPVWARLIAISAASCGALAFAWRQREHKRSFSLTLQGGCIGILLLTIFAAFRIYTYLPQSVAYISTLGLLGLAVWLALRQTAVSLAGFALLGGFLAPLWLSTGGGSHVALFSYYALLNAAIFTIAIKQSWRALNLLGFFFTFGIATLWGALEYTPANYASAQFFLALFFLMYLLIPILTTASWQAQQRDWLDGTLVFGTPLAAFILQSNLLDGQARQLALVAGAIGVLYGLLAWQLRHKKHYQTLVQAYAILATGFVTLAVPLGFSAQTSAGIFALEGAAIAWLGLRQNRIRLLITSALLHTLAALAWVYANIVDWHVAGQSWQAVFNPLFMTTMLMGTAALVTAWLYYCHEDFAKGRLVNAAAIFYTYGILLIASLIWREIERYASTANIMILQLAFLSATGLLAAWLYQVRIRQNALAITAAGFGIWGLAAHWFNDAYLWFYPGWNITNLALLLCIPVSRLTLFWLRKGDAQNAIFKLSNMLWWLHMTAAATVWLWQWLQPLSSTAAVQGWAIVLLSLPAIALASLSTLRPLWLGFGQPYATPRQMQSTAVPMPELIGRIALVAIGILALPAFWVAGKPDPLPWLPVLNPQDLVLLCTLTLFWLQHARKPLQGPAHWRLIATIMAFAWISKSALAAVHHWAGVAWNMEALLASAVAQTTLTLIWGTLAVIAWIQGSRKGNRPLWLVGLAIMGLVLLKLFLMDRQHLGNLLGIVSFIGYGLLCVAVGYIAPSPPRNTKEN